MPGTKWLDGSLRKDLPMQRLAELYNVNNYIVSQTNPYIVPFLHDHTVRNKIQNFFGTLTYSEIDLRLKQLAFVLNRTERFHSMVSIVDTISAIVRQQYKGNITLHPKATIWSYKRLFHNLPYEDVEKFILDGERAVWSKLNFIHNQTKIAQTLERCVRRLRNPGKWIVHTSQRDSR